MSFFICFLAKLRSKKNRFSCFAFIINVVYINLVLLCPFVAGVFYCGAHGLVGELRRLSQDFSRKTETKFDFHKENF